MTDESKIGEIRISKIIEHEDGSADLEFDMDEGVAVRMANFGLEVSLYCRACGVGTQDVLNWISSHLEEKEHDGL